MYFCDNYLFFNGPNLKDFSIILIFGVIFGQSLDILPPGCPFIGFPPAVMQIILKI